MRTRVTVVAFALVACRRAPPTPPHGDAVYVVEKRARGRVYLEAVNSTLADVTVRFDATLLHARADPALPVTRVLGPRAKLLLTALTPDAGVAWRYESRYRYVFGSAWARHTPEGSYALPYAFGERAEVMQGWHGRLTHTGIDEQAVDFAMPEGSVIRAARGGVVVIVKDDSTRGCPEPACADLANYILLRHRDGSVAEYGHLRRGGARARPGDMVARGDVIGWSGATGRVTAPHLHFVVRVARDDATWESVPVYFQSAEGDVREPREGERYTALP